MSLHTFSYWPMGSFDPKRSITRDEPSAEVEDCRGSDEKKDDFNSSCINRTPETSFNHGLNKNQVEDLTPPSKCTLRRVPLPVSRVGTHSSASSPNTIKDQLKVWSNRSNLKRDTSSESEFRVRDLLLKTTKDEPLFTSRLIHEFKENYDIPISEDEAIRLDAEHILRQARWTYQPTGSTTKKPLQQQANGSPDTATTASPSFSTDEAPSQEGVDISAITTEQEHYAVLMKGSHDAAVTPNQAASPSSNKKSHLDGLRQLLWPEANQYEVDISDEYDGFDQYSFAGTHSTSTMTFFHQHFSALTCCASLVMPGRSSGKSAYSSFASKSEEDTHLIMDTSIGSFLYLDDDEEDDVYSIDDTNDDEFNSVFDSPELGTSVKHMAKLALAANCSHPSSFEADKADELLQAVETSFVLNDESTLQDAVNLYFLNARDDEQDTNKSGAASYASEELLNEFYTLDDSSYDDQTESAVSETSMVTTPRKNSCPDDTMSTRSVSMKEEYDDEEPPSLRLICKARSIASYEDPRFLC